MNWWTLLTDQLPPPGIDVLAAWNPAHITSPIRVAALVPGRGWYSDGQRMPAPLYWVHLPALPEALREAPK